MFKTMDYWTLSERCLDAAISRRVEVELHAEDITQPCIVYEESSFLLEFSLIDIRRLSPELSEPLCAAEAQRVLENLPNMFAHDAYRMAGAEFEVYITDVTDEDAEYCVRGMIVE